MLKIQRAVKETMSKRAKELWEQEKDLVVKKVAPELYPKLALYFNTRADIETVMKRIDKMEEDKQDTFLITTEGGKFEIHPIRKILKELHTDLLKLSNILGLNSKEHKMSSDEETIYDKQLKIGEE